MVNHKNIVPRSKFIDIHSNEYRQLISIKDNLEDIINIDNYELQHTYENDIKYHQEAQRVGINSILIYYKENDSLHSKSIQLTTIKIVQKITIKGNYTGIKTDIKERIFNYLDSEGFRRFGFPNTDKFDQQVFEFEYVCDNPIIFMEDKDFERFKSLE